MELIRKYTYLLLALLLFSCGDDNEVDPGGNNAAEDCDEEISLKDTIQPIIESNCALSGCHLDRQMPLFENRDDIIANATRIKARVTAGTMPPSNPLDARTMEMIACWVDSGAKDN